MSMISSIDFFYPIVDDPQIQGQLTVANVLSDLYSMGVTNIDHFLMVLGMSDKVNKEERVKVAQRLIEGMNMKISEAKTKITGGQTVLNSSFITGGSVVGFKQTDKLIKNNQTQIGNKILLTKPLGTQQVTDQWRFLQKQKNDKEIQKFKPIYEKCINNMISLNLYPALLFDKYFGNIKACTDITGFGIKGHSDNILDIQLNNVDFYFSQFPVYKGINKYNKKKYKMMSGLDPETSGGLMIVINDKSYKDFQNELFEKYNINSWLIGEVIKGSKKTQIDQNLYLNEIQ